MKRRSLLIGLVILILIGFASVPRVASWWSRRGIIAEQQSVQLPPVQHFNVSASVSSSSSFFSSIPSISSISSPASLSSAVNWDVPFTSQAAAGNWDPPYNEACEEASVFMTLSYFHSQSIASPDDADRGIVAMVAANAALGFPIDDTAAQVQ